MGYTHYWHRKNGRAARESWAHFEEAAAKVLADPEVVPLVCREYDAPGTPAELTADLLRFNGKGGDGHETCFIERTRIRRAYEPTGEPLFDFCKTARKPYDAAVCAVLLCAAKHLPGFDLSSDGTWDEWKPGRDLYLRATGEEPVRPSDVRV